MHRDQRALVGHLFATVTAMLEDAHIEASDGQAHELKRGRYRRHARQILKLVIQIEAIARAILVACGRSGL